MDSTLTRSGRASDSAKAVRIEAILDVERAALVDETLQIFQDLGQRAVHLFAECADRAGITHLGAKALLAIQRLGPEIMLGQIADSIHVPPSSMTGIADRLVRAGLIERGPSAIDRRSVVATITPKGIDAVNGLNSGMQEDLCDVMSSFRDDEIRTFNTLLGEFLGGVERELAKRPGAS